MTILWHLCDGQRPAYLRLSGWGSTHVCRRLEEALETEYNGAVVVQGGGRKE